MIYILQPAINEGYRLSIQNKLGLCVHYYFTDSDEASLALSRLITFKEDEEQIDSASFAS